MRNKNSLLIALVFFLIGSVTINAQEYKPEGYYTSLHGAFDLMVSNHSGLLEDSLFSFYMSGFIVSGIDVGKYLGKENFHLTLSRGFAILPESIEDYNVEPGDKKAELQRSFSLALSYRKQASRIKKTNRIKFNFGGRVTAIYHHYSGVKATRHKDSFGGPPTYSFEDFRMNTVGIEGAPYVELGKQSPGGIGVFLNWEYFYFRAGYQSLALGLQKVSIIVKF